MNLDPVSQLKESIPASLAMDSQGNGAGYVHLPHMDLGDFPARELLQRSSDRVLGQTNSQRAGKVKERLRPRFGDVKSDLDEVGVATCVRAPEYMDAEAVRGAALDPGHHD